MTKDQHPDLEWRGEVPIAQRFDDPYFSLEDGLAETRHVFLTGNGLPERFRPGFHIAELGFGTGLNAFAALALWRASGQEGLLTYTAFERYPMRPDQLRRALQVFPHIADLARPILSAIEAAGGDTWQLDAEALHLRIIVGDARVTVPDWQGQADAWFLDGFSPAKNPELWEPALMAEVARHTAPQGSFATYTAAGAVRRALSDAGFAVERIAGFGRKRHMTVGHLV